MLGQFVIRRSDSTDVMNNKERSAGECMIEERLLLYTHIENML